MKDKIYYTPNMKLNGFIPNEPKKKNRQKKFLAHGKKRMNDR